MSNETVISNKQKKILQRKMSTNMTNIIEKTFSNIPNLITSPFKGKNAKEDASYEFQSFIKRLSSITTREDEIAVIGKELNAEKEKLSKPKISAKEKRECLTRLLYCHMMGYNVSFAYIHALKLVHEGNILEQRTAFVLCSLFLDESPELALLLTCSIQKGLTSTNILEICTALTASTQLALPDMMPILLPSVISNLTHKKEIVRKKAVICLHRFTQKVPELTEDLHHLFEKTLCDKDPGVMWATLHIYYEIMQNDPSKYRKLVTVLTDILMQVISRKLPTDYDYHSVPAPWLTIHLLKLLALLGNQCESTSMQIYPVVKEVLQRTEPTQKMGLAVIYECLETICMIYPQPSLLEHAAKCVSKFLSAKNINLRYLGLKALSKIVANDPKYALDHQQVVMECLEHPDQTVKTQTYHLLLQIANPENVHVISGRLLECLKQSTDRNTSKDLATKIKRLNDRYHQSTQYSNNVEWYLNTVNQLILLASDHLSKNLGIDTVGVLEDKPESVHKYAAAIYWIVLQKQDLPNLLIQLAAAVVSRHWQHLENTNSTQVTSCLLSWLPRCSDTSTQKVVVQGLQKLLPHVPTEQMALFVESIEAAVKASDMQIFQMVKEIKVLVNHPTIFAEVTRCPLDSKMDFSLSFLDDYVSDALENGASPYKPPNYRQFKPNLQMQENSPSLKYQAYESPGSTKGSSVQLRPGSSVMSVTSDDSMGNIELQLKDVKRVWGKGGFKKNDVKNKSPTKTHEENPTQAQSEDVKRKADFQTALFSGISSPEKKKSTEGIVIIHEKHNVHSSDYQPLCDTEATSSHSNHANQFAQVYSDNISSTINKLQGNENVDSHYKVSSEGRQDEQELGMLSEMENFSASPQHILLGNIKDRNFETDSLDGDTDGPPLLFTSDHEDKSLTLQPQGFVHAGGLNLMLSDSENLDSGTKSGESKQDGGGTDV